VVVTNPYSSVTSAVAVVTLDIPLSMTGQPASQTTLSGSAVSFSVAVSGTGPFTYQWQFNGTNLPSPVISTVAGTGIPGYSGDGGAAANAELNYPLGVAVDTSGHLFIADSDNGRIREVGAGGMITTVAGNGRYGYSGDGGPATKAELSGPSGVAVDASGNLFIADASNYRIREVGTNGMITTVAGNGTQGYSGDGGAATGAELSNPNSVAVDASGNLFIADQARNVIREVGTNGIITTVAGYGYMIPISGNPEGYSGDGGAATNARLFSPWGVTLDASGNLFIADVGNGRIREVRTDGIITTVAGNGTQGYSGDGGPATSAQLGYPSSVAVDASGNLFIADSGNAVIREVGTNGIITTVAGNGNSGYSGDGGAATEAELAEPLGLAVDAFGNLFIADHNNSRIRKVVFPGPRLVLANVDGGNAGAYDVVVSSPYGSVTSSVATLVVALNPLNVLVTGGQEAQLQFQGLPGNSYVLLSATHLTPPVDWRPVITSAADTNGQWVFTVTNVLSSDARFYRMSITGQ
jgi:secreted PhoX family phosphatase